MSGDPIHVLLIDSQPDTAARLLETLRADRWVQFSLRVVETCGDAADAVKQHEFDLALLSLRLAGCTASGAIELVQRAAPGLPIIAYTEERDDPNTELALQAGVRGCLVEPAGDFHSAAHAIDSIVSRIRLEKAAQSCERQRIVAAQATLALDTMARQYNSLVDALGVSLCRWLPDTTLVFTNELYRSIFGIRDPDARIRWLDLLPAESRAETAAFYEELVRQPRTVSYEHPVTVGGGEPRHFHWIDAPLFDAQGKLLEYQSIGIDITELKQTQERLRQSEERYQNFVAQSLEAILRIELSEPIDIALPVETQVDLIWANGIIAECNQAMADMAEIESPKSVLGRPLQSAGIWRDDPMERIQLEGFVRSAYRSVSQEVLKHTSDGQPRWLLRNTAGTIEDGHLVRIWSTAVSITERKQAEELVHAQRDLARLVGTVTSSEEAWPRCLDIAMHISGLDSGGLYLFDDKHQCLELVHYQGLSDDFAGKVGRFPIDSPNVQAVLTGSTTIFEGHADNEYVDDSIEKLRSLVIVPIQHQGRVIGCMNLASHTTRRIPEFSRLALETIASEVGNIVVYLQTGAALRESEARAKAMLNAIPDLMFRLNADGVFLDYRAEPNVLYHQSEATLIGRRNRDVTPPAFAELIDTKIRLTLETGQLQTFGYQLEVPDQGVRNFEARMAVSGVDEVTVIVRDITERKRTEESIRYTERRYRHLFEGAPVMYITTRNDQGVAVISDCNELFLATVGYRREEVIGQPLYSFYTPDSRLKLERGGYSTALEGRLSIDERELITKDGRIIPTLFKAVPEHDPDGQVIGTQASYVDITDRKQAEEALKESNERFKQMADNIQEVFWMFDNQLGRIVYLSPAYEKIWGVSVESTYQNSGRYIHSIHPDDQNVMVAALEQQAQGKPTIMEYRVVAPDGAVRWMYDRSFPIFDEDGTLHRTTGIAADITERKNVEIALRLSEEKSRGLIESLDSIVATVDQEGRYLYMNDLAAEQLGGEPSDLIGKSIAELAGEQEATEQLEHINAVLHEGRARSYENLIPIRNKMRWHRTTIQPLHDEFGQVVNVLINSTDIHELKEAQQSLLELNQTLEARVRERTAEVQDLYDNAPTGYHSLDADGCFIMINQTELNWLGYSRDEMLGHVMQEFIMPDSLAVFEHHFPTLKRDGMVRDIELEMRRKDGSVMPVLVGATALYDEFGNFVMSRSTMFDNTERRKAETALRESEEQNRLLFEESPDAVILMTEDGTIVRANRANEQLTLFPRTVLVGSNSKTLGLVDEQTDAYIRGEIMRHVVEHREFAVAQYKMYRPDGSVRDVESRVFLVNIHGETQALTATRDITAHKEAEDALRLANLEMQRALRLKDEFLANMSHELRTPLNGILALSEVLQEQIYGPMNERQLRSLWHIETSGRHLLELINDLLDLSKIDAGKLDLDIVEMVADEVCQASLMFIKELASKKHIKVHYQNDKPSAMMSADPRRLKQMLVNLLSNAVKFTPDDGQVDLRVSVDPQQKLIRFDVQDTGIGIAPGDQGRLFQPFTQLDSTLSRQYEGTGLGLALVRRLAEQHGGSVSVSSTGVRGEGSTFSITLPYLAEKSFASDTDTGEGSPGALSAAAAPKSGPKILLVEDNEINIETVSGYLDFLGYRLFIARNGIDALKYTESHRPDLILMDIQLPLMDGIEVIKHLRKDPRFTIVPIIALTALAMSNDRERCLQAGATAYMSKPIRLTELANLILQLLKS